MYCPYQGSPDGGGYALPHFGGATPFGRSASGRAKADDFGILGWYLFGFLTALYRRDFGAQPYPL